jgi:hypothetical protein
VFIMCFRGPCQGDPGWNEDCLRAPPTPLTPDTRNGPHDFGFKDFLLQWKDEDGHTSIGQMETNQLNTQRSINYNTKDKGKSNRKREQIKIYEFKKDKDNDKLIIINLPSLPRQ